MMFMLLYVGRKRYGFGHLLSLLSVLLIDDIGRKVTPGVVLLAPVALIICMSVSRVVWRKMSGIFSKAPLQSNEEVGGLVVEEEKTSAAAGKLTV
jgi:hypothetical protein